MRRLPSSMTELAASLLRPRAIAVVGASPEPQRIGGQPVRALREFGYSGGIYPVNPKYTEVQGLVCFADIAAVPRPCDIALICVPAVAVAASIRACGQAGIPVAVVLSAGFREIGEAGMPLQAELDSAIAQSGVRVIGPNCQGMLSPAGSVYCGFGAPFMVSHDTSGPVAMVTQSGGFGYAVMGLSEAEGVGFNHVISTGNEADITTLDLIELFLEDVSTRVIAVYMEGIQDGRRLDALGQRALAANKPILVWKVGNSATGRAAAASHTANLSAPAELYRMAFRRGGFVELSDVADLVDVTRAFASPRRPRGNRVAVISISGGAGVLFADLCDAHRLSLPSLSEQTCAVLREALPSFSSLLNPVDVTAQIFNDFSVFKTVVEAVAADPVIDQVVVIMASVAGANAARIASEMAEIARVSDTPLWVVSSALPERAASAREVFASAGIPVYATPGRAALAISAVTDFETRRRRFIHPVSSREQARPGRVPEALIAQLQGTLNERHSKDIAQACGLQVVEEVVLDVSDIQAGRLPDLSWPAVVKLVSVDLPHKTEAGAVRIGVASAQELQQAVAEMLLSARRFAPEARISGVSVQRMAGGIEMIIGTVRDPFFGPVVLVGLGGTMAELFKDIAMRFAPVSEPEAMDMIRETRAWALLEGYRGGPAADVDALAQAVSRISWFASDHQDRVSEIDINPIFVGPAGHGAQVADALVVLDAVRQEQETLLGESIA